MQSLKDNNAKVHNIFSEWNLDIWCAMIDNVQDWHPIDLVIE